MMKFSMKINYKMLEKKTNNIVSFIWGGSMDFFVIFIEGFSCELLKI